MKKILATLLSGSLLALALSIPSAQAATSNKKPPTMKTAKAPTYKLTWSEDFTTGASLDPKVWAPQNGDGTAQQTCYYGPCQWLSAKYQTQGLLGFKYGRIEARIKGAIGTGTWGAFWLLGANIATKPWPACGEIDIAEFVGRDPNTNYGTPHGPSTSTSFTTQVKGGVGNNYHTYALDWLPDQITWYLDGKPYGIFKKSSLSDPNRTWVFNHEFFMIFNLAMGGNFAGTIDPSLTDATTQLQWIHFSTINGVGQIIPHN